MDHSICEKLTDSFFCKSLTSVRVEVVFVACMVLMHVFFFQNMEFAKAVERLLKLAVRSH